MSLLDRGPALGAIGGLRTVAPGPVHEVFAGKDVPLGAGTRVSRTLPNLGRRMVGAWCFVDHYGAGDLADISDGPGMQVPPHPHIGLQTVSWLLEGTVHHRDSLGSDQLIEPGQLGLMTAGRGITHAEQSPVPRPDLLHGMQLWIALPESARHEEGTWDYHAGPPTVLEPGGTATVIVGELAGVRSPGRVHSPLLGVDAVINRGASLRLPLEPGFEHAVLLMDGTAQVDGAELPPGSMLYLGTSRTDLAMSSDTGARVLLLGGEPFEERIVMWWNFVARSNDEIVAARRAWADGDHFGDVPGYNGYRLAAPDLPPGPLKAR